MPVIEELRTPPASNKSAKQDQPSPKKSPLATPMPGETLPKGQSPTRQAPAANGNNAADDGSAVEEISGEEVAQLEAQLLELQNLRSQLEGLRTAANKASGGAEGMQEMLLGQGLAQMMGQMMAGQMGLDLLSQLQSLPEADMEKAVDGLNMDQLDAVVRQIQAEESGKGGQQSTARQNISAAQEQLDEQKRELAELEEKHAQLRTLEDQLVKLQEEDRAMAQRVIEPAMETQESDDVPAVAVEDEKMYEGEPGEVEEGQYEESAVGMETEEMLENNPDFVRLREELEKQKALYAQLKEAEQQLLVLKKGLESAGALGEGKGDVSQADAMRAVLNMLNEQTEQMPGAAQDEEEQVKVVQNAPPMRSPPRPPAPVRRQPNMSPARARTLAELAAQDEEIAELLKERERLESLRAKLLAEADQQAAARPVPVAQQHNVQNRGGRSARPNHAPPVPPRTTSAPSAPTASPAVMRQLRRQEEEMKNMAAVQEMLAAMNMGRDTDEAKYQQMLRNLSPSPESGVRRGPQSTTSSGYQRLAFRSPSPKDRPPRRAHGKAPHPATLEELVANMSTTSRGMLRYFLAANEGDSDYVSNMLRCLCAISHSDDGKHASLQIMERLVKKVLDSEEEEEQRSRRALAKEQERTLMLAPMGGRVIKQAIDEAVVARVGKIADLVASCVADVLKQSSLERVTSELNSYLSRLAIELLRSIGDEDDMVFDNRVLLNLENSLVTHLNGFKGQAVRTVLSELEGCIRDELYTELLLKSVVDDVREASVGF
eukprot:Clim_evm35s236 gene=Clim_evmTU35s236